VVSHVGINRIDDIFGYADIALTLCQKVIDSFNKKEPIKVLVQANLDIERSNDYDNVTFQTTMSRAFRGATVKGTSLALDDIH